MGLGYVGLPLALEAARAGLQVVGVDEDEAVVSGLNQGRSHVDDITDGEIHQATTHGESPPRQMGPIGKLSPDKCHRASKSASAIFACQRSLASTLSRMISVPKNKSANMLVKAKADPTR